MRFSTFLLLFFLFFQCLPQAKAQNLIADWSAEEYETCPTGLALTLFIPTWLSLRGNPDYFNTCSPNLGPLTNPFGWQHPKSGEGTMGVITHHSGFVNGREYAGVELLEPLSIGETYEISYYAALAYNQSVSSNRATNNLGILLMTENYLTTNELGIVPNFAHCNTETLVTDTANWVQIKCEIVADSAYKYVAFGNFFDDSSTLVISFNPADPSPGPLSYYYFDDFCVVLSGGECQSALSNNIESSSLLNIFPNPVNSEMNIQCNGRILNLKLLGIDGSIIQRFDSIVVSHDNLYKQRITHVPLGIYILQIETEEGILRSKIVINP